MALEMVRIDDRLIHGQVVAGWCPQIKPDHLILCNDEVAQSEWEAELYKDAACEYKTSVCTVAQTAEILKSEQAQRERIFLVADSPKTIAELVRLGAPIKKVVIGGMHYHPQKRCIAPFIYVDDEDIENLKFLAENNIALEGRDVPTCKAIDVNKLLSFEKSSSS